MAIRNISYPQRSTGRRMAVRPPCVRHYHVPMSTHKVLFLELKEGGSVITASRIMPGRLPAVGPWRHKDLGP